MHWFVRHKAKPGKTLSAAHKTPPRASPTPEHIMTATATRLGHEHAASLPPADRPPAAHLTNIALFFAAPFIGRPIALMPFRLSVIPGTLQGPGAPSPRC
jgi:hypothetical protein